MVRLKAAGLWFLAILSVLFLTAAWIRSRMAAAGEDHRVAAAQKAAVAEADLQKADEHIARAAVHAQAADNAEGNAAAAHLRLLEAKARAARLMETIRGHMTNDVGRGGGVGR